MRPSQIRPTYPRICTHVHEILPGRTLQRLLQWHENVFLIVNDFKEVIKVQYITWSVWPCWRAVGWCRWGRRAAAGAARRRARPRWRGARARAAAGAPRRTARAAPPTARPDRTLSCSLGSAAATREYAIVDLSGNESNRLGIGNDLQSQCYSWSVWSNILTLFTNAAKSYRMYDETVRSGGDVISKWTQGPNMVNLSINNKEWQSQ